MHAIAYLYCLPIELIMQIFEHLDDWHDVATTARVNRHFRDIVRKNVTRLARPCAELVIKNSASRGKTLSPMTIAENEVQNWELELTRCFSKECQKEWNAPIDNVFEHLELSSLTVKGPFLKKDLLALTHLIRIGRQRRIRSFCLENVEFKDACVTKQFFDQICTQQNCERIQMKNCNFIEPFEELFTYNHFGTSLSEMFECLIQFQMENCEEDNRRKGNAITFSEKTLAKFARDLRFKIKQNKIPFLWHAPLPVLDPNGTLSEFFMNALCQFIENWLYNSEAPHFHVIIDNCPQDFAAQLAEHCFRHGISHHMFLQFPSRACYRAQIKSKYNEETQTFELFSVRETPSSSPHHKVSALSMARFYRQL